MSGNIVSIGNCCLYSFGFSQQEVDNLTSSYERVGYNEVLRQSTTFRRICNWIFGVHKADAAKALYWLTHAKTAEEAHYHFLRLQTCVGAHANKLQSDYNSGANWFCYKMDISEFSFQNLASQLEWKSQYQLQCPLSDDAGDSTETTPLMSSSNRNPTMAVMQSASMRSPLKELKMSWHWLKWMTDKNYKMPGLAHTFNEIFRFSDKQLENVHNFIQLLFPNVAPSPYNPNAPLLTDLIKTAIKHDTNLQQSVKQCLDHMLSFYGLKREGDVISIDPAKDSQHDKWKTSKNHNHKRLSRIMHCLNELGFAKCAQSLKECLLENASEVISRRVKNVWTNEVKYNGELDEQLCFEDLPKLSNKKADNVSAFSSDNESND